MVSVTVAGFWTVLVLMISEAATFTENSQRKEEAAQLQDRTHQNATNILNNLLVGYEQRVRPGINGFQGPPTKILVDLNIRSMGPISEVDMTYSMDAYFRQTWEDTRLSFDGEAEMMAVQIKLLEKIWTPDTFFYNGQGSYLHMNTSPNKLLRIMKNGTILYSMRLTIKANCPMYLHYFPMDEQSCPLQLGSYAYTEDQLLYEWKRGPVNAIKTAGDMRLSQFDLMGHPARNQTVLRSGGYYSTLKVNFLLQRHMGYFLIQVYVPCSLIVVLSWVSFWINREATADRVELGITTVLTLTTLSLDTRDDLPKVSYATALDWFVITCFGFVTASLLEFAGVHYFTKLGSGEIGMIDMEDEDENETESHNVTEYSDQVSSTPTNSYTTYCNSGSVRSDPVRSHGIRDQQILTRQAYRALTGPARHRGCFKFFKCLQGSHSYRKSMQRRAQLSGVNSVSKIDKVSRILFPMSFTILNVLYWVAYTRGPLD